MSRLRRKPPDGGSVHIKLNRRSAAIPNNGIAALLISTKLYIFIAYFASYSIIHVCALTFTQARFFSFQPESDKFDHDRPRCRSPPVLHFRYSKITIMEESEMAGFKYCFIKESNAYIRIPCSDLLRDGKRNPKYAGRYFLPYGDCLLEVSHSSYLAEHKRKRRIKYLREEAILHREISYNALDTEAFTGEEIIPDTDDSVEYIAIRELMIQKLRLCLADLSEEERELLTLRYFERKSETACAKIYAVNQSTISRRERKILKKLQKLMET